MISVTEDPLSVQDGSGVRLTPRIPVSINTEWGVCNLKPGNHLVSGFKFSSENNLPNQSTWFLRSPDHILQRFHFTAASKTKWWSPTPRPQSGYLYTFTTHPEKQESKWKGNCLLKYLLEVSLAPSNPPKLSNPPVVINNWSEHTALKNGNDGDKDGLLLQRNIHLSSFTLIKIDCFLKDL